MFALCHETTTHHKWMLGLPEGGPGKVWLHEYKSDRSGPEGFAEVPHDHRYTFVSTIISGGYVEEYWEVPADRARVRQSHTIERFAGETHVVNHSAVHSLREILPGTMTIVVEGPERQPVSTSWHRDGTPRGRHETFMSRFDSVFGT